MLFSSKSNLKQSLNTKTNFSIAAAFSAAFSLTPLSATAGIITDYLGSIGVTTPSAKNSAASAWTPTDASVGYFIEDFVGANGYVGPGYGGQYYDLEALYVDHVGSTYVITGVSGAPQVGPAGAPPPTTNALWTQYGLGDFFVGTLDGSGDFNAAFAIELDGFTYGINSSGYTNAQSAAHDAGTIVTGMNVRLGLSNWGGVSDPAGIDGVSGTIQGYAVMNYEYLNSNHTGFQAVIEESLFESLLGGNEFIVHWGEACGNDFLRTAFSVNKVPEPAGWLMFLSGLLGLILVSRMQRK